MEQNRHEWRNILLENYSAIVKNVFLITQKLQNSLYYMPLNKNALLKKGLAFLMAPKIHPIFHNYHKYENYRGQNH